MPSSHEFPPFTIKYPVEFYIDVYNKRFPTHPLFPFILESEVVEYNNDKETGHIKTTRKIKLDIDAPGWFKTLTGLQFSVFIEESDFDTKNRRMTVVTKNETLSSKAVLTDNSSYEADPNNPDWTIFKQEGNVDLKLSIFGFTKKIEAFMLERYSKRYDESRKLDEQMIEYCLQDIEKQKIEELDRQQKNGDKPDEASKSVVSIA